MQHVLKINVTQQVLSRDANTHTHTHIYIYIYNIYIYIYIYICSTLIFIVKNIQ